MGFIKNIFIATVILGTSAANSFAGSNLRINTANGEVIYKQTFKLDAKFTEDDAYDLVQSWLTQSPAKFNRQNAEFPGNARSKNKQEVEEVFSNARPLQALDPESKRVTGKGVVKYYGGSNSGINLLYMEYYLILQVSGHEVTATICEIKYHHYNRSYSLAPIYSWQGGKPIDDTDSFGKLLEANNPEVNKVGSFMNDEMANLFTDLKQLLAEKSVLSAR